MRTIQWQRNQNGTHFADWNGKRVSVRRSAPRARLFIASIEGERIGIFANLDLAKEAAERAALPPAPTTGDTHGQ